MLAISVENVSKLYHLGTLTRKILWKEAAAKFGLRRSQKKLDEDSRQDFWALKNVSFEVKQGETLGIVGANGAGKSTLLKIISRITTPTSGTVRLNGRVGSLLEVGTGFNPEMTGRENVYLNGSIQGMKKADIDTRFSDIVSFAGVEKFIDTPVKRYSSGMYVRLAFSVAAFLDAEILIVDEVLSVGDQQFQNRCISRLQDIIRDGRTVLFVSHGAGQIRKLCTRAICLQRGELLCDSEANVALDLYQAAVREEGQVINQMPEEKLEKPMTSEVIFAADKQPGGDAVKILSCRLTNEHGILINETLTSEQFFAELRFLVLKEGLYLRPGCTVSDELGNVLFWTSDSDPELRDHVTLPGMHTARLRLPGRFFALGRLTFSFGIGDSRAVGTGDAYAYTGDALSIFVKDDFDDTRVRGLYRGPLPGFIRPKMDWSTTRISS